MLLKPACLLTRPGGKKVLLKNAVEVEGCWLKVMGRVVADGRVPLGLAGAHRRSA